MTDAGCASSSHVLFCSIRSAIRYREVHVDFLNTVLIVGNGGREHALLKALLVRTAHSAFMLTLETPAWSVMVAPLLIKK